MSGVVLARHAETVLAERGIRYEWVVRTLDAPAQTRPDGADPALVHPLRRIPEFGDRVLRVVSSRTLPPRVVTAYFDRTLFTDPLR